MKKKLLLFGFLLCLLSAKAQHPWLIKDVNTSGVTNILNDGIAIGAGG